MTLPIRDTDGTLITYPRELYINFRNLIGRQIQRQELQVIRESFNQAAFRVSENALIKAEILQASPVEGEKRTELLTQASTDDLDSLDPALIRVLRLSFEQPAAQQPPLRLALDINLCRRDMKSATLIVHAPDGGPFNECYDVFKKIDALKQKGLLNEVAFTYTDSKGSLSWQQREYSRSSFRFSY